MLGLLLPVYRNLVQGLDQQKSWKVRLPVAYQRLGRGLASAPLCQVQLLVLMPVGHWMQGQEIARRARKPL